MKKNLTTVLIVLSALLTFLGCDKGNNNNNNTPPPPIDAYGGIPGLQACVGCFGNSVLALKNVNSSTPSEHLQFAMDVYVDGARAYNIADPHFIAYYMGSVAVDGFMQINSGGPDLCYAQPGQYRVSTLRPGQALGRIVTGLNIAAVNSAGQQILMTVYDSTLRNVNLLSRDSTTNRISMNIILQSVNGVSCGLILTR